MILITLIAKQYTFIDKLKYQNATFPPNFYYSIFFIASIPRNNKCDHSTVSLAFFYLSGNNLMLLLINN